MNARRISKRTVVAWVAAGVTVAAVLAGCGIAIRRELTIKPSEVVYDDACGLQEYFDALKSPAVGPPVETFSQDMTMKDSKGGRTRFMFTGDFQMHYLKNILQQNWKRLPPELLDAQAIELEVQWSEKAGVKRVITTDEAVAMVGDKSWFLPYHVCLSDLLFGESLYDTRRVFLQLPPPRPNPLVPQVDVDAGAITTPAMARAGLVGTNNMPDADVNREHLDAAIPPNTTFKRTTKTISPAPLEYPGR